MASIPLGSSMSCKSCSVGCACSCLATPFAYVHAEPKKAPIAYVIVDPKKAQDPNGESAAQINDRGDTLKVICVEGHGRSLCFEVDNFEDEIPPWVLRWMEKHAANCGGTICWPDETGYESGDSTSAISVDSVKDGTSAVYGPGLSLILLSDSDSDIDE